MKFLYANFLKDKRVYSLNEGFYAKIIKRLTKDTPSSFFNTQFRNGEKFYDGNPMYSVLVDDRILRIIQEEPESDQLHITAWLDKATDKDLDELVISLELSKEATSILELLIKKWLVERLEKVQMQKIIDQAIA